MFLFFKGSGSIKYSAILFVYIYKCSCTLWPTLMPVFIYIYVLVFLFCVWLWYLIIYNLLHHDGTVVYVPVLVVLKIHIQIITAVHVHAQVYRQIILNVYMYMNLHTWHILFHICRNGSINQRVEISWNKLQIFHVQYVVFNFLIYKWFQYIFQIVKKWYNIIK